MIDHILAQNKQSWDAMADTWFGSTALPAYGCLIPDEGELMLFPDLKGKRVLDIGCGSGHSLKWCGDNGASELWGVDISSKQIENAQRYLSENGYASRLLNAPMEADSGIPSAYFDAVYSVYAIGWTVDLQKTMNNIATYLKRGGVFVFSWDHPLMHCVSAQEETLIFDGSYHDDGMFSYMQRGNPVTIQNHKMSGWINALAVAGFKVERLIEDTDKSVLEREHEFSPGYYAPSKAKMLPLSFVIKAVKL